MSQYTDIEFKIEEMVGQSPREIIRHYGGECDYDGKKLLSFFMHGGKEFHFVYYQDCCADVYLQDVDGDLSDLLDETITSAEIVSSEGIKSLKGKEEDDHCDDSYTWTFYKISNKKTSITLRFYGSSNGYYSEEVSLVKEFKNED